MTFLRILFLLCVVLGFSSCSKLSIGVYWADTFALSKIDDFFTLNADQREIVRKEFLKAFHEVRRREFPLLADLLDEIAADVEKRSFDESRISLWSKRSVDLVKNVAARFEPLGQKLMEWQAERGFSRFDEAFFRGQKKREKQLITPADRLRQAWKRADRVIGESVEFLLPEQQSIVDTVLSENPLLLEQKTREISFQKFVAARSREGSRREYVRKYFYDWDSLQDPEFLRARDAYQKKSVQLILRILQSSDEEQRRNLAENFRDRAAQLRELSKVSD